ncbi:hypothetical protein, partial [Actinacidiphila sp. bgisy167]|uniref:hypothetical protein n=1 Tax=Actinacidiphila sp. bgisy167 TaxID=3413797 RepID=UPI003D71EE0E
MEDSLFGDASTSSRESTPGLALPGRTGHIQPEHQAQPPRQRLTGATNDQPPVTTTRPTPIDVDSQIPTHSSPAAERALGAAAYMLWSTPTHNPPAWARGDELPTLTNQQIDDIITLAETNPHATFGGIWDHIDATYHIQLPPEEINRLHHQYALRAHDTQEVSQDVSQEVSATGIPYLQAAKQWYEKHGNL